MRPHASSLWPAQQVEGWNFGRSRAHHQPRVQSHLTHGQEFDFPCCHRWTRMANDARPARKRPRVSRRKSCHWAEHDMTGHMAPRIELKPPAPFTGLNTSSPLHMNTQTEAPIETLNAFRTAVLLQHFQHGGLRCSLHDENWHCRGLHL